MESAFLAPPGFRQQYLDAFTVFDAIRTQTNPPISEEEFNEIADRLDPR